MSRDKGRHVVTSCGGRFCARPHRRKAFGRVMTAGVLRGILGLCVWSCCAGAPAVAETADEYFTRGFTLYSEGNFAKAAEVLRKALEQDPQHTHAKALLKAVEQADGRGGTGSAPNLVAQLTEALSDQEEEHQRLRQVIASAEARIKELVGQRQTDQQTIGDLGRQLAETRRQLTEELSRLRTEHEELTQRWTALEQDRKALQGELQTRHKAYATLQQELAELRDRLTRQEEQLQAMSVDKDASQQQLTGLRAEQRGLEEQLRQAQTAHQKREASLQAELMEAQAAHRQLAQRLESVEQERARLEAVASEVKRMQAALTKAQQSTASSEQRLAASETKLNELQRALQAQTEARRQVERERDELSRVKDQLEVRFSETQRQLTDDLTVLQSIKSEHDALQQGVGTRDQQLGQLREELVKAKRDFSELKVAHDRVEAEVQGRDQQVRISQQGMELQQERLKEQLQEAQAATERLMRELEAERTQRNEFKGALAQREAQLKQTESMVQLMQSTGGVLAVPVQTPGQGATTQTSSGASASAEVSSGAPSVSDALQGSPVKIYQVDKEFDFVVISVHEISQAAEGMSLVLANSTNPVVTVELTDLDEAGFAVAQITHRTDPGYEFIKGDVLFARQLIKPVIQ